MKVFWLIVTRILVSALTATAAEQAPPSSKEPLFSEVSPETSGLKYVHTLDEDALQAYLYQSAYACGSVALGDLDGDNRCDIFLVGGVDDNALFLNCGGLKFEKSPASATLADQGSWGVGCALADVDGDADLDIYVCNYDGINRLWLNDGHGGFAEVAAKAGLDVSGPSHCPYFSDLDNDGDLDMLLVTNRLYSPTGRPKGDASEIGPDGQPRIKDKYASYFRVVTLPDGVEETEGAGAPARSGSLKRQFLLEYGHPDRLFRNDGPGSDGVPRFKDVTQGSGLEGVAGHGLSALLWDVNGDGFIDIYVANDYTDEDQLWLNLGPSSDGGFHFRDAKDEFLPYTTWSSMGSDVADINGDGLLDFMVADMAATTHFKAKTTMGEMSGYRRYVMENGWPRQVMRNMLFVATSAGRFLESAFQAGVARSDWTWAVKFGDYDLDGRPDVFMSNGVARSFSDSDIPLTAAKVTGHTEWEIYKDTPPMKEKNLAFRNNGQLHFTDVSNAWGLDKEGMSFGAASGDLDNDGDLDLVVCNLTENVSLYRNKAADQTSAHWLRVKLEGNKNRFGEGAIVTAKLEDGSLVTRLMNTQTGFLSVNEQVLHFGLGSATKIVSLEVRWPGGTVQQVGSQKADRMITVRESTTASKLAEKSPQPAHFVEVSDKLGLVYQHTENPFDDYKREFLLPGKLSQFGPGVAVSDVNDDGLDDVFVGGGAGQSGSLFIHQPDHKFSRLADPPWAAHAASEDMGALFFDADRDGDLDLYVASGSNQWEVGDAHYTDHLYLNKTVSGGPMIFAEAPEGALPDVRQSGSCVVGADFDRDGDVDLFIGARSVPGQYLAIPESVLLQNKGEAAGQPSFIDVTDEVAPQLKHAGMVTSALWSDVDSDGWIDLLVACEWGPVRLFSNVHGRLIEATKDAGLSDRHGWWNGLTAGDFDGDGDTDYLLLNAGLNTKYGHATATKPLFLYRGDMDGNGVSDLIESKASPDGELPVRGKSCSSTAMPTLKKKFPTFRAFASANLEGIYSGEKLSESEKVFANELATGCLINHSEAGRPRFVWHVLPSLTQISACYGAVTADFFGEGTNAAALAQNIFSREPETGLWRGGLGVVLRPNKNGIWSELEAGRSGFVIPSDGKGLAVIDLNADGRPDIVATQNADRLLAFENNHVQSGDMLTIRLQGPSGNPTCLGARLTIQKAGKIIYSTEVYGGSGYLSQSTPTIHVARPKEGDDIVILVQWPSGQLSQTPLKESSNTVTLSPPPS